MRHITAQHMIGFNDELSKEAGRFTDLLGRARGFFRETAPVSRGLGYLGREMKGRYGRQLLAGTGAGALGGAVLADPEEGESRLRGAMKGALVGGALTGGGILATKAGREAARKGTGHFLQRQRYALTGRGLGKTEAEQLAKAKEIGLIRSGSPEIDVEAFKKGYMSAPGVIQGLLSKEAPDVIRSGWKRSGVLGKAFAGLGAYQTGKGLIEKPQEGGPGRLEKGLRGAGSTLGWMVAPASLLGGHLVGEGVGRVGGLIGKGGDIATRAIQRRGQLAPAQQAPGRWEGEWSRTGSRWVPGE